MDGTIMNADIESALTGNGFAENNKTILFSHFMNSETSCFDPLKI